MLNIQFLGTGGNMPMTFRALASVIINFSGRKILIDCGEGTQVSMRKYRTGFKDIDIILLTHMHGDHIFGLPGLLATMGNSDRTEPVLIVVPKGSRRIIEGLLFSLNTLPFKIIIEEDPSNLYLKVGKEILIEEVSKPEIIIKTCPLHHRGPCIGYSIEVTRKPKFNVEAAKKLDLPVQYWKYLQSGEKVVYEGREYYPEMVLGKVRSGIKMTYVTDTRPVDGILDFIRGSDLFICEGTYGSDEDREKAIKNKHMTFREAATLAVHANVKSLLLTHFSPSMDYPKEHLSNALRIFSKASIAQEGQEIELRYEDD